MEFRGAAKRLADIDLPQIGASIGVGEDEIHAILEVESSGGGFDKQGRPKALYEPHVAYRLSSGATRRALVAAGLAYPKWGEKPYPKDSYQRILRACEIDETIALKATSWGLGQILGENHQAAGYLSARSMVEAFAESEAKQLAAMVDFMKSKRIDRALQAIHAKARSGTIVTAADWIPVALPYNGKGYAKHNYHGRLAAAYAKWRKIKDTPYGKATATEVFERAELETEAHEAAVEAAPPAPLEKTGITETTAVTGGFSLTALIYSGWEMIQQAPQSILDALIEKPHIAILAAVVIGLTYIGYRRWCQKCVADE